MQSPPRTGWGTEDPGPWGKAAASHLHPAWLRQRQLEAGVPWKETPGQGGPCLQLCKAQVPEEKCL